MNAYSVEFHFNNDWDGLEKVAVFKIRDHIVKILIDSVTNQCMIPWDVFKKKYVGNTLYAGVYGTGNNGNLVIPTIYTSLGVLQQGAEEGCAENEVPSSPDLVNQILSELHHKVDERNEMTAEEILDMWTEEVLDE